MVKNKKRIFILAGILLLIVLAGYVILQKQGVSGNAVKSSATPVKITYSNLAIELSKNSMVKALPDKAVISLSIGEKSYTLRKGNATEGKADGADIIINLPSKYLEGMTSSNFCSIIKEANNNGDLGFETSLSKVGLLWKYKGMLKYKGCFGL